MHTKMFLLDTLDSMPRLRVSDGLMKIFLWVLKESGALDVPSLGQLREVQATLRNSSGVPSDLHKSAHNNAFYMNDIRSIVAKVCCPSVPNFLQPHRHHIRITPTPTLGRRFRSIQKFLTVLSPRSGTQKSGEKRWTSGSSVQCTQMEVAIFMCWSLRG